jgi:GMP synthase (glutamine-hydrolysing)
VSWLNKSCLAQALGGDVRVAEGGGEYGRMAIRTTPASLLYTGEADAKQQVWMSHGDEAVRLPEGFEPVATSEQVRGLPICHFNVVRTY